MAKSVIITCAVTGSIHTPTMSDHLPITPNEIAADAIAAAPTSAAAPTLNCATGFDIVPACFPTSKTPFLAMPFSSSLTSDFLIFLAFLYILIKFAALLDPK